VHEESGCATEIPPDRADAYTSSPERVREIVLCIVPGTSKAVAPQAVTHESRRGREVDLPSHGLVFTVWSGIFITIFECLHT